MAEFFRVSGLSKKYSTGRGVESMDFSLNQGHVLALLGPNGAGKTTILKALTGLVRKNSGQVKLLGLSLEEDFESYIRNIGTMIGATSHQVYLTGMEQLQLKGNFYNETVERLEDLLTKVGLYAYKDEIIKNYSTGMKQRLALAYALIGQPKLLLLDEPFSGMDVEVKRQMRNLLEELIQQEQITMIISSHMVGEIQSFYTHMAVLQEGLLVGIVEAETIKASGLSLEDYYINYVDNYHKHNKVSELIQSERRKAI